MGLGELFSKKMLFSALTTFAVLIIIQNVLSGGLIQGEPVLDSVPVFHIEQESEELGLSTNPVSAAEAPTLHGRATPVVEIPPPPPKLGDRFENCPVAVSKVYESPEFESAADNHAWCKEKASSLGIRIGKTWGSAPKVIQQEWNKRSCNDIILNGGIPRTCNEKNGWNYFDDWINSRQTRLVPESYSQMNCGKDAKLSVVCSFQNVVVDFGKASIRGSSRSFGQGFVRAYGKLRDPSGLSDMMIPGLVVDESSATGAGTFGGVGTNVLCDEHETRPTFIMSHDDTDNLAHHINDVTMVWAMGILAGRAFNDSLLIHMDGIRRSGPAGGLHRLMHVATPDSPSTFNDYYLSWFGELKKGIDYRKKKVCFKEIYFQPMPGLSWVWDGWAEVKPCAAKTYAVGGVERPVPSPLFQSFNLHLRRAWENKFGSLAPPAKDSFHILLISRRASSKKGGAGRVVANNDQLATALQALDLSAKGLTVRVSVVDFATMAFSEQMRLVHTAHLLIGMHGAGINQFFNMPIGEPNCCGLVELFPDKALGYDGILGNQNMAKFLGMSYARYNVESKSAHAPVVVGVPPVVGVVQGMINVLTAGSGRICLNDVKDSTNSIVYAKKNLHSNK